jgi:cytochrome c556
MTKTKLLAGLSAVAGLAVVMTGVSVAQQDVIAKRKALMKQNGAAFKVSNEMVKGEKPFDAKAAADAMNKIAGSWAEFAKLFPKGSEKGGETTAAPKIWETFKDFDDKGQAFAKAAADAAKEAAKGADAFKAAFGKVAVCKGCHDVYRIPKK